ncbi:hypothetical protein PUN28_004393 [Cardiocondyla obscurior]|uniref:Uncharacterized protein n=1 Tax=Cardiocondyla obscurior TaxID=286306 RepID=A0AAW2GCA2_9HYME
MDFTPSPPVGRRRWGCRLSVEGPAGGKQGVEGGEGDCSRFPCPRKREGARREPARGGR